ncbi:MAG: gliding motility-associated C-terminal domain-containing protein [Flavobacteriales bacterium]|nr:gliding motility-associated C-terminal domain-containing protein [Flavobacteriales bacterium]
MRKFLFGAITFLMLALPGKAQDVGITSIISPVNGCCVGMDTVRLYLYNYSLFPIGGNFNICYTVNGGAPICETILTSISPNASYLFGFNTQWNFQCPGSYQVCATVTFAGDVNLANNSLCLNMVSDTFVVGGSIVGPDTVCALANNGVMVLQDNNHNDSLLWQFSNDGFITSANTPNDSASYLFSGLTQTTTFRVFVDGGYCPDGYSTTHTINVDQPPVAGTLLSNMNVCAGNNTGQLDMVGGFGDSIFWSSSIGGPFTNFANDSSSYTFNNLAQTTQFQAWISNGVCPPTGSNIITVTTDPPTVPGTVSGATVECFGVNTGSVNLLANNGNILGWIYSSDNGSTWQNNSNTTAILNYTNLTDTTIYCAVVQSTGCPADTSVCDTVIVVPLPVADAGVDDTIFIYDQTQLMGSGGLFYTWTPTDSLSDPNLSNPFAKPSVTTTYTLTVTDAYGCFDTDDVTIFVIDTTAPPTPTTITITNYISVNGDGLNDVWNIMNIEYFPDNEVMIFNNQGEIVYEKSGYDNTWGGTYNGDKLPDGSYFYVVKVNSLNQKVKGVLTITSK